MRLLLLVASACASPAAEPLPAGRAPDGFWEVWGDGKAELAGYRLAQPRYGSVRRGEAVLVFVTETFTDKARVKSDGGHPDEFPVIKLNDTRDFQTGFYDYNAMTSAFVRLDGSDPIGVPTKVAFGAQEWCGHVYDQLVTRGGRADRTSHSYFDGEGDREQQVDIPKGAFFLDVAPLIVRGFVGDVLEGAPSREVAVYARLLDQRFAHRDAAFVVGTLSRETETQVTVPAGDLSVDRWTLAVGNDLWTWDVEDASPHRLVRWTGPGGELGELTGSLRSPYWQQNREGDEVLRAELGLATPSWLTPPAGARE